MWRNREEFTVHWWFWYISMGMLTVTAERTPQLDENKGFVTKHTKHGGWHCVLSGFTLGEMLQIGTEERSPMFKNRASDSYDDWACLLVWCLYILVVRSTFPPGCPALMARCQEKRSRVGVTGYISHQEFYATGKKGKVEPRTIQPGWERVPRVLEGL